MSEIGFPKDSLPIVILVPIPIAGRVSRDEPLIMSNHMWYTDLRMTSHLISAQPVQKILSAAGSANIHLLEPLAYLEFVAVLSRATLVLTDSGGVQEEAPAWASRYW